VFSAEVSNEVDRGKSVALDQKMDRHVDATDVKFREVKGRIDSVIKLQFSILLALIVGLFGVITKLL
jgi:hypothetical protein